MRLAWLAALLIASMCSCSSSPTTSKEVPQLAVRWIQATSWAFPCTPVVRDSTFLCNATHSSLDEFRISDGTTLRSITLPQALLTGAPAPDGDVIFLGLANSAVGSRDGAALAPRWTTYLYPPDSLNGDEHIEYDTNSPAVDAARIYVASTQGVVDALDRSTGARVWRHVVSGVASSAPIVANGLVYVAGFDRHLTALEPTTGAVRWQTALGEDIQHTRPIFFNQSIYIAGMAGFVHRIDAETGAVIWQRKVAADIRDGISVTDEALVAADDSGIFAVNPRNGRALWQKPEPALNPVQDGGLVYIHSRAGRFLVLEPSTGRLVASADLPPPSFVGSPVILQDRILVPCRGAIACIDKPAVQNKVLFR